MSSQCRTGGGTDRMRGALIEGVLVLASTQLAAALCLYACQLACGRDFTREEGGDTAACGVSNLTPRELAQVVAIGVLASEARRLAPGRFATAPLSALAAGAGAWVVGAQVDLSALEPPTGIASLVVGLASVVCSLVPWVWGTVRSRSRRTGIGRAGRIAARRPLVALAVQSLVAAAVAGLVAGLPDSLWWWLEAACDPILPPAVRCGDAESALRSAGVALSLGVSQTFSFAFRRTTRLASQAHHT